MQYVKQTLKDPYTGGSPYQQEEITRAEALEHVSEKRMAEMEDHARRYSGLALGVLQEVTPGFWVGVMV